MDGEGLPGGGSSGNGRPRLGEKETGFFPAPLGKKGDPGLERKEPSGAGRERGEERRHEVCMIPLRPMAEPGGPVPAGTGFFPLSFLLVLSFLLLPGASLSASPPGGGKKEKPPSFFAPLLVGGPGGVEAVLVRKKEIPAVLQVRRAGRAWKEVPAGSGRVLRVGLPPLEGRGPFSYRFSWKGGATPWYGFRPLPRPGAGRLSFAAYGDSRSNPRVHQALAAHMEARRPDLVVNTGDLVGRGSVWAQWERSYLGPLAPLASHTPIFTVMGNHEGENPSYFALCTRSGKKKAWWSADAGPVHFIGLDSNVSLDPGSPQRKWLEADLAKAAGTRAWKILLLHHPFFTACPGREPLRKVRALLPLLEARGVSLVLEGHDHHYMRTYPVVLESREKSAPGVVCVTTGGGGAPLYPVHPVPFAAKAVKTWHYLWIEARPDRLTGKVFDWKGKEIDSWTLTRKTGMPGPRYWVGSEEIVRAARSALDGIGPLLLGPGFPRSVRFAPLFPGGAGPLPDMDLVLRAGKGQEALWSLSGGGNAVPGKPWPWEIHCPPPGEISAGAPWPRLVLDFQMRGFAGNRRLLGPLPVWKRRGPWHGGGRGMRPIALVDRWGRPLSPGMLEISRREGSLVVLFQSPFGRKKTSKPRKPRPAQWARRSLAERLALFLCGPGGKRMQSFQVTRGYRSFHTGWGKKGLSPRAGWSVQVLPGLKGRGWGARWEIHLGERGLPSPAEGLLFQVSHELPFQDFFASSGPIESDHSPWPASMESLFFPKAQ